MIYNSQVFSNKVLKEDIGTNNHFRDTDFVVILHVPTLKEADELHDIVIRKLRTWNKTH